MKACVLYKNFYWRSKEAGDSIIKILQIIDHEKRGMGEQIFSGIISIKNKQFLKQGQYMRSAVLYPHTQGLIADYAASDRTQYLYFIEIYSSIAALAEPLEAAYGAFISFGEVICKNLFAFKAKMLGAEIKSLTNVLNNAIIGAALKSSAYMDVMRLAKAASIISQIRIFGSNIVFAGLSQFMTKGLALEAVFRFYVGLNLVLMLLKENLLFLILMISVSFNTQSIKDFLDLHYLLIHTRFKSF